MHFQLSISVKSFVKPRKAAISAFSPPEVNLKAWNEMRNQKSFQVPGKLQALHCILQKWHCKVIVREGNKNYSNSQDSCKPCIVSTRSDIKMKQNEKTYIISSPRKAESPALSTPEVKLKMKQNGKTKIISSPRKAASPALHSPGVTLHRIIV